MALLARSASSLTQTRCPAASISVSVPSARRPLQAHRAAPTWAPAPAQAPRLSRHVARAAASEGADEEPELAQEAITLGLTKTNAGKWEEGLQMFERALQLPGTGVKRFRDKPRAPSDRERMTALYNIACCHSRLNDVRSGLVALAGCLEAGYADFPQIRRDPDLETLRQDPRFEGLIQRFEPSAASNLLGFDLGSIFGRK